MPYPQRHPINFPEIALHVASGRTLTTAHILYAREARAAGAEPYSFQRFSALCKRAREAPPSNGHDAEVRADAGIAGRNLIAPVLDPPHFDPASGLLWSDCPGSTLKTRAGELTIETKAGAWRFPAQSHRIKTVMLSGRGAAITTGAIGWLEAHDICVLLAQDAGSPLAVVLGAPGNGIAALSRRRAQMIEALADKQRSLAIAAAIVRAKIATLGLERSVTRDLKTRLGAAKTLLDVTRAEGIATHSFWIRWRGSELKFKGQVPPAWRTFGYRNRRERGQILMRDARDCANAMLSYAYQIGHNQASRALVSLGYDVAFGFLHRDKAGRNSLSYDCLELLRAHLTAIVFAFIKERVFVREDFAVLDGGIVRLGRIVARDLACAVLKELRPRDYLIAAKRIGKIIDQS